MSSTANFFQVGRMIGSSKSGYMAKHPDHVVVFNANVYTKDPIVKVWYGDLDLTTDAEKLKELSRTIGFNLYVLREMDGRFDNEVNPKIDRSVALVTPDALILKE